MISDFWVYLFFVFLVAIVFEVISKQKSEVSSSDYDDISAMLKDVQLTEDSRYKLKKLVEDSMSNNRLRQLDYEVIKNKYKDFLKESSKQRMFMACNELESSGDQQG